MKKLLLMVWGVTCIWASAVAQDKKDDTKMARQKARKGAKAAAHNTAEVATRAKAKVTDNVYKDKVAPNGETVYIDGESRYYWVNDKGHKIYVEEHQLRPKTEK